MLPVSRVVRVLFGGGGIDNLLTLCANFHCATLAGRGGESCEHIKHQRGGGWFGLPKPPFAYGTPPCRVVVSKA